MIKVDLKTDLSFLKEYVELCALEWGNPKNNIEIQDKINLILSGDKVISVLGIVEDRKLIGFISLFKYDGDERKDLFPWYATMYVKEEYRVNGYSKVLNEMIIEEAIKLGYKRIYLKTDLNNYYEKFGAIYVEDLKCGEKLYYIDCVK